MISEQTEAVVLRMHAWSETSLIGTLYTRSYGKISMVAKGARRPKSPFEAALDLLSVCRVVFIARSGDALNILTEAKLQNRFHIIDRNLLRLYCAYYVVELLEKFTEPGVPTQRGAWPRRDQGDTVNENVVGDHPDADARSHEELFELANDTLRKLEQPVCDVRAVVLRYELQLLRLTGHLPSLRDCVQCGKRPDSDRWMMYGPGAGGVLCSGCATGVRWLIRVPKEAVASVEPYSRRYWQSMELDSYSSDYRKVIRAMMTKTIAHVLDRKLHLYPYLEELGR